MTQPPTRICERNGCDNPATKGERVCVRCLYAAKSAAIRDAVTRRRDHKPMCYDCGVVELVTSSYRCGKCRRKRIRERQAAEDVAQTRARAESLARMEQRRADADAVRVAKAAAVLAARVARKAARDAKAHSMPPEWEDGLLEAISMVCADVGITCSDLVGRKYSHQLHVGDVRVPSLKRLWPALRRHGLKMSDVMLTAEKLWDEG